MGGTTLPIIPQNGASPATAGRATPFSDSALFALLMAEAGAVAAGGIERGDGEAVVPEVPEPTGNSEPGTPAVNGVIEDSPIPGSGSEFEKAFAGAGRTPEPFAPEHVVVGDSRHSADSTLIRTDVHETVQADARSASGGRVAPGSIEPASSAAGSAPTGEPDVVSDPEAISGRFPDARPDLKSAGSAAELEVHPDRFPSRAPRSLAQLDLEGFDVKRIDVQVEQTGRPSPERAAATPNARLEPGQSLSPTRGDFSAGVPGDAIPVPPPHREISNRSRFADQRNLAVDESEGLLSDMHTADESIRPRAMELLADRATSEPQWEYLVSARRHGKAEPGASAQPAPEAQTNGPDVQPETRSHGDVFQEPRDQRTVGGERRVLLPQPPKPVDPPTFALEPARRVMMTMGDAGNEVHVLVHETNGEVSIRFESPHALRANLEGSAHQLVESMSREEISLADLSFSGPSHGDDPNGRSHDVPRQGGRKSSAGEAGEPTTDSHLEFARAESRIQIRV